jgi:hypothetical protein
MKISLMRKFDRLSLMDMPEGKMWDMIDDLFDHADYEIEAKLLIEAVDFFISHLPRNHDIDGKEWFKLISIAEDVRKHKDATTKQKRFVGLIIAANWNKIEQTAEFGLL